MDTIWTNINGGDWHTASNWSNGVPTQANKAVFNAASFDVANKVITFSALAECGGIDSSAVDVVFTIQSSVYELHIYGDFTSNGTNSKYTFTGTAYVRMKGSGTITTNGNLFLALNRFYIDGVGITVTNGDDCNMGSANIYPSNGTWNTNNKQITCDSIRFQTGTFILNCGSSVINLLQIWRDAGTVTFNSGTSTFNFYGTDIAVVGTLNSVTGTFYNITRISGATIISYLEFWQNTTVSNNLTISGANASNNRLIVRPNTIGTPRTITVNGSIVASNVDFRDITLEGTANRDLSAISGGSGDCGGNSGIIFTPAVDTYLQHTSGAMNASDPTKWSVRVPLPQDRAWGNASSFSGPSTINVNLPRIGSIDLSAVDKAVTLALANAIECYGNYVLGVNITPSGDYVVIFLGRVFQYFISTLNKSHVQFSFLVGTYTFISDVSISNAINTGINGGVNSLCTVYLNGYNLTIGSYAQITQGSTIYLGNGIIEFTRTTAGLTFYNNYATIYSQESTVKLNPVSGNGNIEMRNNSPTVFNKVQLSGNHTGNFDITGSNTFNRLIIDKGRKVRVIAGTTQTIGDMVIGDNVTITSPTAAQHTLTYTGGKPIQAKFANISYSKVLPQNKWWAGASVDGGNNTNWRFAFFGKGINYLNGTRVIQALRAKK